MDTMRMSTTARWEVSNDEGEALEHTADQGITDVRVGEQVGIGARLNSRED